MTPSFSAEKALALTQINLEPRAIYGRMSLRGDPTQPLWRGEGRAAAYRRQIFLPITAFGSQAPRQTWSDAGKVTARFRRIHAIGVMERAPCTAL